MVRSARKGKGRKWARIYDRLCRSCFVIGMYVQVIPFLCLEFIGISGEGGGKVRSVWYALYGIDDHCVKNMVWFIMTKCDVASYGSETYTVFCWAAQVLGNALCVESRRDRHTTGDNRSEIFFLGLYEVHTWSDTTGDRAAFWVFTSHDTYPPEDPLTVVPSGLARFNPSRNQIDCSGRPGWSRRSNVERTGLDQTGWRSSGGHPWLTTRGRKRERGNRETS